MRKIKAKILLPLLLIFTAFLFSCGGSGTVNVVVQPTVPALTPTGGITVIPTGNPTATPSGIDLTLIKTVNITPDETYKIGGFCRINHIPSKDRFVVTCSSDPPEGHAYFYKEYTPDMEYTGTNGTLKAELRGDYASVMVGDYYYLLTGGEGGPSWQILKFDMNWKQVGRVQISDINTAIEGTGDQMLSYVNGQLDASGIYKINPTPDPYVGEGTHHRFFTTDLQFVNKKYLADTPHIDGSSMLFVDNTYHLISSTAYFGQLIVIHYDTNWTYLGSHILTQHRGQWPQGSIYLNGKYYIAYISDRNIKLGIYNKEWQLISTTAVTNFTPQDLKSAGRPWVIHHNNKLYVSYDVETSNSSGQTNRDWAGVVQVYQMK